MFELFAILVIPVIIGFHIARFLLWWAQNLFIDWQIEHDLTVSKRIEKQLIELGVDPEQAKEAGLGMATENRDMRDRITYYMVEKGQDYLGARVYAQGDIGREVSNKTSLDYTTDVVFTLLGFLFAGAVISLPFWLVYFGFKLLMRGYL